MEDDERESQRATHREKNKQTNKQTKKQKKNVENGLTADRSGGGEAGVLLSVGQVVAAVAVRRAVLVVGRVRRAADDVGQRQFRRRGRQFGNVIRHVIHRRRRRRGAATPLDGLQRHGPQVDASADLQVLQPLQRRSVQLQRSRLAIKESGPEKSKKKKKKTRKKNERWFVRLVQFSPSSFRFSLVSIRVSFSFHFFFVRYRLWRSHLFGLVSSTGWSLSTVSLPFSSYSSTESYRIWRKLERHQRHRSNALQLPVLWHYRPDYLVLPSCTAPGWLHETRTEKRQQVRKQPSALAIESIGFVFF